uniref:Eukaryotic translation initiation factor 3 subunit 10 n=1 Tax=Romanomermis culicivorax TaxID=13658 RepID=A0A915IK11_ROMCU
MVTWLKPENALRRANELVEVGRKQDALDTLHEVIKNRKVRQWTKVHEQIMLKHLELCVELRKPHLAKDGLFQYRNMCQSVNAKSLEDVIQVFLTLSEKKAEQARQELLLSVVTGEGSQERADRTILSPWLRFLWEAYRQCLELLRNNIQVETLYHRIAKQAFHFCLEYQRKAEFRKLCDNLRTHLNQIQKAQHLNQTPKGHYALKLTNPETVAFHQETRLVQLDIAIKMELWQEAFKSVEDVHQLMELMHVSKKGVRPAALASYYEKVALIFWKADNPLYHAAALMKLLQLTKEHKRAASAEELSKLATRVLLAVLSVNASNTCSDLSRHLEMDETFLENQRRLASLIKLPSPPTRQSLLKDAKQIEILNETAKPEETKYIGCLKNVAAAKILRQISQIYSSATFVFLCKIIPYFDKAAIENLIVSMGKRHHFQIRLHHRTDSVEFGLQDQTSVDDPTSPSGDIGSGTGGHQNSQLNVPVVQTMPGEQIRQHLQQMYTALQDADASLDADVHSQKLAEALRNRINLYRFHARDQHIAIINRKKMIESYKETNERIKLNHEQQQKEQERLMNEQKQREIDQRLQQEKVERLEQQKRREQEELKQRMMQDKLDKMKDPKLRKLIEEMPGAELDHDKILEKQILHLEQEKRETMNKLKSQEKKWDYYVRAMHLEELPLRKEEYEKWAVEDVDHWENYETYRIDKAIEEHKLLVETVDRMKRMEDDARDIIARIKAGRQGDFQQKLRDWEKRLSQKRVERLAERKRERKEKRREQWLEERREAERREAERRKKEDEERQRREQEASGRRGGTDAFGKDRFQRRTYNDQEGDREPSGADSDKWVRGQTPFQK